jgi:Activator of Hsp90 ATPase homolog 1-like protein
MTAPAQPLAPIHKSVTVPWPQERAFTRFTADLGTWWPYHGYSVGQRKVARCIFEGRVGGQIYEEWKDGTRHVWGTVTVWEPHSRAAFSWHPGRAPDRAQNIEVRFTPEGNRTRLDLTHRGWEHYGADAAKARRGYPVGWTHVLNCWADRPHHPMNLVMDGLIFVMTAPLRVWLGVAAVFLLANAVGAWIAYGRSEMLHGHTHTVLAGASVIWVMWLWSRIRLSPSEPATARQK